MKRFTSRLRTSIVALCGTFLFGTLAVRADTIFASVVTNDNIRSFETSGADHGIFANSPGTPTGLSLDISGHLYVANSNGNTVRRFSPTGVALGIFANTGLNGPTALAFDLSGNLYVSNGDNNSIRKFSATGVDLGYFVAPNTGLNNPQGIAFDVSGNLYVASPGGGATPTFAVERFSPTGTYLGVFATTSGSPLGLAFDASGNLYVTDYEKVAKFSAAGVDLGVFTNTPLLTAIAFDSVGNLYGTTVSDGIKKFSPTGADLGSIATGGQLGGPSNGIVILVPEPSTGLLLFSGVAMSLVAFTRKRK